MTKARKIGSEDASPGRATRRSAVGARADYSGRIGRNVQTARPSMSEPLRRTGGKTASPSTTSSLVRKFGVWHCSRRVSGPLSESPPMSLRASRFPRARPKNSGIGRRLAPTNPLRTCQVLIKLLLLLSRLLRSLLLGRLLLCRHWRITSSSVSKHLGRWVRHRHEVVLAAEPLGPGGHDGALPSAHHGLAFYTKHASCHDVRLSPVISFKPMVYRSLEVICLNWQDSTGWGYHGGEIV